MSEKLHQNTNNWRIDDEIHNDGGEIKDISDESKSEGAGGAVRLRGEVCLKKSYRNWRG